MTNMLVTYRVDIPKEIKKNKFIFVIAEKPSAVKRIAKSLSSRSKAFKVRVSRMEGKKEDNLPIIEGYITPYEGKTIVILPALGHLFTLSQGGIGWQYPVYDFIWIPLHEQGKDDRDYKFNRRVEATIEGMRYVANLTNQHVVATDYDEEGEVIGGLTLAKLVGQNVLEKVTRMKYSSFAKKEIQAAMNEVLEKKPPLNHGMYNRGLMRHYLDWLWGINLSRALMLSLKNVSGRYHTLSTGRVQGPTLSFVAQREFEIETFVPVPRFKINLTLDTNPELEPKYSKGMLDVKTTAAALVKKIKGQKAMVVEKESKTRKVAPPAPYNLSTLQKDAYRYFKLSPSRTLRAAENLYLDAVISYPRTSSQKYPPGLDHKEILASLSTISGFKKIVAKIDHAKKPVEGKKTDPAHPCLYPTGDAPGKLKGDNKKIFELIVHRYLATFGSSAQVSHEKIIIDINGEEFTISGKITKTKGWMEMAGKYGSAVDNPLPKLRKGSKVDVKKSSSKETFSNAPPRYNQSSLLKEMEEKDIGTKATRSEIISSIFDRKYLHSDPIRISEIGDIVNTVLQEYSPQVISVELSRELEKMGDLIEETINARMKKPFTLADAMVQGVIHLHNMLDNLREKEEEVGHMIHKSLSKQRRQEVIIGKCMNCEDGELKIIRNQATGKRFVGCTSYFDNQRCNVTFPLPQKGKLIPIVELCKSDGYPQLRVFSGKRPWTLCLHPECKIMQAFKDRMEKNGKGRGNA